MIRTARDELPDNRDLDQPNSSSKTLKNSPTGEQQADDHELRQGGTEDNQVSWVHCIFLERGAAPACARPPTGTGTARRTGTSPDTSRAGGCRSRNPCRTRGKAQQSGIDEVKSGGLSDNSRSHDINRLNGNRRSFRIPNATVSGCPDPYSFRLPSHGIRDR